MNLMRAAMPSGKCAAVPADITAYLSIMTGSDVGRLFFRPVNFSMRYSLRPDRPCHAYVLPSPGTAMIMSCSGFMGDDSTGAHAVRSAWRGKQGSARPCAELGCVWPEHVCAGAEQVCHGLRRGFGHWQATAMVCRHDAMLRTCNHVFV